MSQIDSKLVTEVVDRLKKQGLFDKFRKECLADVDTKPAYQNLTHRVEGAISRFLSTQKWRPDLNKNQLRESLRRHLNELPMLLVGVDRVVDQVVNPKIYKDFKPQIDKVICEHLGLDYDKWIAKQNGEEDENDVQTTVPSVSASDYASGGGGVEGNIPNLMDLEVLPPKRGSSSTSGSTQPPPPPNGTDFSTQGPPVSVPPPLPLSHMTELTPDFTSSSPNVNVPYHPSPSQFEMAPPLPPPLPPPSLPPPLPPHGYYMPYPSGSMFHSSGLSYSAAQQMGIGMIPTGLPLPPGIDPLMRSMAVGMDGFLHHHLQQQQQQQPSETEKEKKKKKAMEPLTVESLLNVSSLKFKETNKTTKDDAKKMTKMEGEDHRQMSEEEAVQESQPMELCDDDDDDDDDDSDNDEAADVAASSSKEYHFIWDEIDADHMSSMTISSVHSSDLSSFEDEEEVDEEKEEKDEERSDDNNKSEKVEKSVTVVGEESKEVTKKRLSLQYRYSESESEETKEERRTRVAEEKEKRCLRRQQRRAELESKRKEKDEEEKETKENVQNEDIVSKSTEKSNVPRRTLQNRKVKESSEDITAETREKDEEGKEDDEEMSRENVAAAEREILKQRRRKTKEEMKEELREKKVMEKKRELRRQRTLNRKYLSDDFTSIFTQKKHLLSGTRYLEEEEEEEEEDKEEESEVVEQEELVEESVVEQLEEINTGGLDLGDEFVVAADSCLGEAVAITTASSLDLEQITDSQGLVEEGRGGMSLRLDENSLPPPSPYSNISSEEEDRSSLDSVIVVDVKPGRTHERDKRKKTKKREKRGHRDRDRERSRHSSRDSRRKIEDSYQTRRHGSRTDHRSPIRNDDDEYRIEDDLDITMSEDDNSKRASSSGVKMEDDDESRCSDERTSKQSINRINFGQAAKFSSKHFVGSDGNAVQHSRSHHGGHLRRHHTWQHLGTGDPKTSPVDDRGRFSADNRHSYLAHSLPRSHRSPSYPGSQFPDDVYRNSPSRIPSHSEGVWQKEGHSISELNCRSRSQMEPEVSYRGRSHMEGTSEVNYRSRSQTMSSTGKSSPGRHTEGRSRSPIAGIHKESKSRSRSSQRSLSKQSRSPGEMSSSSNSSSCSRRRGGRVTGDGSSPTVWDTSSYHGSLQLPKRSSKPSQYHATDSTTSYQQQRSHRALPPPPQPSYDEPRTRTRHLPTPLSSPSYDDQSIMVRTRAGVRKSEEENAPIAKRLRR